MSNILHPLSHYSIALNPIFTDYTLSLSFPNLRTASPLMEPPPRQGKNHYSQTIPEAHLERILIFNTAANLYCKFDVAFQLSAFMHYTAGNSSP
jgi:hypothetical protein